MVIVITIKNTAILFEMLLSQKVHKMGIIRKLRVLLGLMFAACQPSPVVTIYTPTPVNRDGWRIPVMQGAVDHAIDSYANKSYANRFDSDAQDIGAGRPFRWDNYTLNRFISGPEIEKYYEMQLSKQGYQVEQNGYDKSRNKGSVVFHKSEKNPC